MKLRLLLIALLVALVFASPVSALKVKLPDGTLKRKALKELFSDKTVNTITAAQGHLAVSYYSADGEVRQLRKDTLWRGTWRVTKKGRLCVQMEGLREKCRIIVKDGSAYKKYIVKKNGEHQHTLTYLSFSDGNPYGL